MKHESEIQLGIISYLESEGWYVVKLIQTTKNGIPDLLCLKKKRYLWIEVKRPGKEAEPLQSYRHDELRKHKAEVITVCSKEEVKKYLTT